MSDSPLEMSGRVALVTGGGRGIGRAVAIALAGAGAAVAINYRRDAESATRTVDEVNAKGGNAAAFAAEVGADSTVLRDLIGRVHDHFGYPDILVHNAGRASRGNTILDSSSEEYRQLLDVNLFGPLELTRLLLPHMRTQERSDTVFVSSAEATRCTANGGPYNVGKAAMDAFALTLAREERRFGMRVNVVAPGLVASEMGEKLVSGTVNKTIDEIGHHYPYGRVCTPEDVAGAVLYLVSDLACYVTGHRLVVDGGLPEDPAISRQVAEGP